MTSTNTKKYNDLQTEGTGEGYTIEPKGRGFDEIDRLFFKEWTLEVTMARREQFNQWVRSTPDAANKLIEKQKELGWTATSLKAAVDHYGL